jgi:hypothetical protein
MTESLQANMQALRARLRISQQLHQFIFPHALAPVAFQNRFTGHARRSNFPLA